MRRLWSTLCALLLAAAPAGRTIELPPGFVAETVVDSLNAVTAMAVDDEGRIFIADQTGLIRLWQNGHLANSPVLDLSPKVDSYWERGLVGFALHPGFPREPHVYVLYVAASPAPHHVVSRFTWKEGVFDAASETILLKDNVQSTEGATHPGGHQGGPVVFGPDGKLYVSVGDLTIADRAQRLDNLNGKILRLNPDGTIPTDNPFRGSAPGAHGAIWAYGLRNVFGLAFQPGSGRLFATEVGLTSWEEINEIVRGGNYGWPIHEGFGRDPRFLDPLHAYTPLTGRSIVGGVFYPRQGGAFPATWQGQFFFADWGNHWIKVVDPEATPPLKARSFARGLNHPVALVVAPGGDLLVLNRGTIWRDGKRFVSNSGSIVRIRHTGETTAPADDWPPPTLAATGVFADLAGMKIRPDFHAFELNAPPWLPGVRTRRWISVPGHKEIAVTAAGTLRLPAGSTVVQHFETGAGRPFETHVYWFTSEAPRAAAYRWDGAGRGATVLTENEIVDLPDAPTGTRWHSPAPESALDLEGTVSGFILPLTLAQLNRDAPGANPGAPAANQLLAWSRRGWLSPPLGRAEVSGLPRLAALDDPIAPLDLRVRSYLEANCLSCHRPGGPARAEFDLRAYTPLAEAGLVDAMPIAGDLGIADARIVAPGDPARSLLLQRFLGPVEYRMPPIRLHDLPPPVIPYLEEWIRSLPSQSDPR